MANYKKHIENKYGVKSFQATKNTYDWILKALKKGEFTDIKVNASFDFDISDIYCSCVGIEEFIENAYGQKDYEFSSMDLVVYLGHSEMVLILVKFDGGIVISTESKVLLEKIVMLLEKTSLEDKEEIESVTFTLIDKQINNGVMIHGDNNTVANNRSSIKQFSQNQIESKVKSWINSILQNLLANGIWYLLCLAAGAILAYFVSR